LIHNQLRVQEKKKEKEKREKKETKEINFEEKLANGPSSLALLLTNTGENMI